MTRKEANMEIIRLLVNIINMYPDQRFGQLLVNYKVIEDDGDTFFKESEESLRNLKESLSNK